MNQINIKDRNIKDQECDVSWLPRIPDELKLEVFKNLSPKDLSSVSKTCLELHGIIQDPSLWVWTEQSSLWTSVRREGLWSRKWKYSTYSTLWKSPTRQGFKFFTKTRVLFINSTISNNLHIYGIYILHFTAAAMLSVLGGEEPTSANLDKVLCSVGIDADSWRMYRVTQADGGQLVECRIQIFRYLQTRVVVWLYENVNVNVNDRLSVLMSTWASSWTRPQRKTRRGTQASPWAGCKFWNFNQFCPD